MKGKVLDIVIVVVEGDGVAQRVQPVEVANSTRMIDGERKKKRGCALQSPSTAVVKSTGAGDLTTSGSPVQNGRQRLPRFQNWGRITPSGNMQSQKSPAGCIGTGLLHFTGYRVNFTDQP